MMAHLCPQQVHVRADGCNHPYTVGLVSTPYGCGVKEMNIRSDWVFCLWGYVVAGCREPDRTLNGVRPNRYTEPMLCDKYRSRGASVPTCPTCPCHDTDDTLFEGMENTETPRKCRAQGGHETVTVTPVHTSERLNELRLP